MNRKHILKVAFFMTIWFLFVCCIFFAENSVPIHTIRNILWIIVIGIFIPIQFIRKDRKLKGFFSRIRALGMRYSLKKCGKNLRIGENVKIFHPEKIQIGDNVDIADDVVFAPLVERNGEEYKSEIIIGNNVHFGTQDRIASKDMVIIEDDVLFAAFVHVTDHSHDYHNVALPIAKQGVMGKGKVVIKKGAWLAFGCHILSGVTVGENSVVAANSVVTKDVPPYSVVAGNPARVVSAYDFQAARWEKIRKEDAVRGTCNPDGVRL